MRAAGGPVTSLSVRRFFTVRSVATVAARPRRFLEEPPDAHGRSGPQRHMFVLVFTGMKLVRVTFPLKQFSVAGLLVIRLSSRLAFHLSVSAL